jgi:hypothetical protein
MALHDWSKPLITADGRKEWLESVRVRLLDPYTIVASVVMRTKSGRTHLPCIADRGSMFECGQNTAANPVRGGAERIDGPTLITCKRCTLLALMTLGRRGLLKWSACARRPRSSRRKS